MDIMFKEGRGRGDATPEDDKTLSLVVSVMVCSVDLCRRHGVIGAWCYQCVSLWLVR